MGSEERQRDWLDSMNHPDLIESCRALVAPRERKYEPLLGPATTIYYIYLGRCRESQEWNGIPDIREMQALSPIPTHPSLRVEQRKRKRKREPKQCAVVQLATLAHGYRGNRKKAEHDASRRISRTYFNCWDMFEHLPPRGLYTAAKHSPFYMLYLFLAPNLNQMYLLVLQTRIHLFRFGFCRIGPNLKYVIAYVYTQYERIKRSIQSESKQEWFNIIQTLYAP